jgi:hypothetical protein
MPLQVEDSLNRNGDREEQPSPVALPVMGGHNERRDGT